MTKLKKDCQLPTVNQSKSLMVVWTSLQPNWIISNIEKVAGLSNDFSFHFQYYKTTPYVQ